MIPLIRNPLPGNYDFNHLKAFHNKIFGKIYPWAGQVRQIDLNKGEPILENHSVGYSSAQFVESYGKNSTDQFRNIDLSRYHTKEDKAASLSERISEVWVTHAFREGNTRTVSAYLQQFAREKGFRLDSREFERRADGLSFRDRLVIASAKFDYDPLNKSIISARAKSLEHDYKIVKTVVGDLDKAYNSSTDPIRNVMVAKEKAAELLSSYGITKNDYRDISRAVIKEKEKEIEYDIEK